MKSVYLLLLAFLFTIQGISQPIVIGVSENPPLVFQNKESGKAEGLFIDVIEEIAKKESWTLEYRFGTFNENLKWLEEGSIDIFPDLAKSRERESIYLFHEEALINSWGQIYSNGYNINDIFDLENKVVGYVENDYFVEVPINGLKGQFGTYGITASFKAFENYQQVAEAINKEVVDVGVFNRIYGEVFKEEFDLNSEPIVFAPVGLFFGISKTRPELVPILSAQIKSVKNDGNRVYSQFIKRYLTVDTVNVIPSWIQVSGLTVLVLLILMALLMFLLRKQVRIKSQTIEESKDFIVQSLDRLRYSLHSAKEGLFTYDPEQRKIYIDENSHNVSGWNLAGKTMNINDFISKVHEEDQVLLDPIRLKSISDKKATLSAQIRIVKPDSSVSWALITAETSSDIIPGKAMMFGTMRDIDAEKTAQIETEELLNNVSQRNKEVNCLYRVSRLISDPSISPEEIFTRTAILIPESMNNPGATNIKIEIGKRSYTSENYREPAMKFQSAIRLDNKVYGNIQVGTSSISKDKANGFTSEEKNMVESISALLSQVLEQQNLRERIEQTEFNERERLAKELHDGVQQTLTVATINLNNVIKKESDHLKQDGSEKLETALEYVKQSTNEIRTIAHSITFDYVKSVEKFLHDIESSSEIHFNFYHNLGSERLPAKIEKELFRITQEALNNIIKHSNATKSEIQLMKYDDVIILTIEDNGKGFEAKNEEESFGISGMRNRSSSINGIFTIDSNVDKGTIITIEIPNTW